MQRINKVHIVLKLILLVLCVVPLLDHPIAFSANPLAFQVRTPTPVGGGHDKIAFFAVQATGAGKEDLYVMNTDGSQRRKLTSRNNIDGFSGGLSWSPDGKQIAFSTYNKGYQICIIDVDSANQRCLPNNKVDEVSPVWLPDGHHIAFLSEVIPGGERKLYIMDEQGNQRHQIGSSVALPAWSPSGMQMAFVSLEDSGYEIYTMNSDGTNKHRLTYNPSYDLDPTWSPDGQQIAFVSEREGDREIYVMNADGSNQRRLSKDSTYTFSPQWSPNGKQIAFISDRSGNPELYVINADGSGQRRLTYNKDSPEINFQWLPNWSPDGQHIVFTSYQNGDNGNIYQVIYRVTVDNLEIRQLTASNADNNGAVWSP